MRTEKLYRLERKRYLCLWLRLSRLPDAAARSILGSHSLVKSQLSALQALWSNLIWDSLSQASRRKVDADGDNHKESEEEAEEEEEEEEEEIKD